MTTATIANDQQDIALLMSKRSKCEIWTRVMGYHRPVSQYNVGKKSEYYSRLYFNQADTMRGASSDNCCK